LSNDSIITCLCGCSEERALKFKAAMVRLKVFNCPPRREGTSWSRERVERMIDKRKLLAEKGKYLGDEIRKDLEILRSKTKSAIR
jgi:hypothetical protein